MVRLHGLASMDSLCENASLPIIARPCNFALVTIMLVRLSKFAPRHGRRILPEDTYRAPRKDCQETVDDPSEDQRRRAHEKSGWPFHLREPANLRASRTQESAPPSADRRNGIASFSAARLREHAHR